MFLVEPEKLPTSRQVIVDYIHHLAVDPGPDSGQDDRVRTVVDLGERHDIRAAQVQKNTESSRTNPSRDSRLSRTIDGAGPDDDIWDGMLSPILHDELVLLHLRVAIGLAATGRVAFDRARLVQNVA